MRDLTAHVDYRTRYLQDEADARRLAASAEGPASAPRSPSARRRLVATTVLALSIAIGSSSAYLAFAAEPTGSNPVGTTAMPAPVASTPPAREERHVPNLPPAGGLIVHR